MILTAEAVKAANSTFTGMDIFILLFTLLIAAGVYRLVKQTNKNFFAIGFGTISLLTFLAIDLLMVLNWLDLLDGVQKTVAKFM